MRLKRPPKNVQIAGYVILMIIYIFFLAWLFDHTGWNEVLNTFFDRMEWWLMGLFSIGAAIAILAFTAIVMTIFDLIVKITYTLCTIRKEDKKLRRTEW